MKLARRCFTIFKFYLRYWLVKCFRMYEEVLKRGQNHSWSIAKKMIKGAWLRPSDRLDLSIFWDQSSFAIKMFKKKATLTKELQMRSNLVGTEFLNILLIKFEFTLCWI